MTHRDLHAHTVRSLDRRSFVKTVGLGAAALSLPRPLLASSRSARPYNYAGTMVRVRGSVRAGDRGLPGVAVSDGLDVVETAGDGSFELISPNRPFVYISLPSGYRLPRNPVGTTRFYEPLRPSREGEAEASFQLQPLEVSDHRHAALVLPDPQTEDAQEMRWLHEQTVPDVRETLRQMGDVEVFGVACGDIMFDKLELFPDYERAVSRMGVPFFQVVGNHDVDVDELTDEASTAVFSSYFGPTYYSFDRGEVHYVVLDDVFWYGGGYIGYVDADQLAWLEKDLARMEPGRTVIVALHIPILGSSHLRNGRDRPLLNFAVTNRESLYRLLEPFAVHLVAGHTHESEHLFHHGLHEHVSGTVCGAWWSGPICADGTPNGYSVYEIDGSSVSWRYKATGRDFDHQMRVYPRGADPASPEEIVANVWNWDPEWTVVWWEDGSRKGEMARRVGLDPLAVQLHTGPEIPPRRPWVEPYGTGHLFYAPVSQRARDVRVEVTDRFGRSYSATPAPLTETSLTIPAR